MKIFNLLKTRINSKFHTIITNKFIPNRYSIRLFSTEHKCNDPSHNHGPQDTPQVQSIKQILREIQTEDGKNIVVIAN